MSAFEAAAQQLVGDYVAIEYHDDPENILVVKAQAIDTTGIYFTRDDDKPGWISLERVASIQWSPESAVPVEVPAAAKVVRGRR